MSRIKAVYYWVKYTRIASDLIGIPLVLCGIYAMVYLLRNYYDLYTPEVSGGFYIGLMYGLLKVMFSSLGSFGFIYGAFRRTLWDYYWRYNGDGETSFQRDFWDAIEYPKQLWRIVIFFSVYFIVFFSLLHVKIGA